MKIIFTIICCLILYSNLTAFVKLDSLNKVSVDDVKLGSLSNYTYYNLVSSLKKNQINYRDTFYRFDPLKSNIDYNLLAGFGGVYLAAGIGLHIYQSNAWWKKDSLYVGKFKFVNDWNYALWIDKTGHFYATHLLAHAFSGGLEAANIQDEQSAWYSASLALLFELYIETEDGFAAPRWGFSPGDALADFGGASFYVLQYYYPYLKNFQFKWSYLPSRKFRENSNKIIIDDYEGQKYWLSLRVKNMLPKSAAEYWPSFLNIAGGMGVKNLDGAGGGQREFYIALDLDVEQLPLYGKFWQFVKNSFNYIHFPMPGVRITPDAAFFVLCY